MDEPRTEPNRTGLRLFAHSPKRHWIVGLASAVLALAALVAGSEYGKVSGRALDPRLIMWISAAVVLVFGAVASTRVSWILGRAVSASSLPSAGGAVRIVSSAAGYVIVICALLAELRVSIEHLLVGAGVVGIVLGIAAQQSLGNVFAGIVLMVAQPFRVGDQIRVRSGALGGIFDATVREMNLTYVSLRTDDGEAKVPNSAMLAAAVIRTPKTPLPPPAPPPAPPARPALTKAEADPLPKDGERSEDAG